MIRLQWHARCPFVSLKNANIGLLNEEWRAMGPRVYRYLPHLRWAQYMAVGVYSLLVVGPTAIWAVRAYWLDQPFLAYAGMALFFGLLAMALLFGLRTLSSTLVTVDEEGLHYRTFRKDIRVRFDEITGLKHPWIPYTGGWLKIISDKPDIRLTVVLEDLDQLLMDIKAGIDAADKSEVYDRNKLFGFYKTAGYSARSWGRLYKLFIPVVLSTILLTPLAIGAMARWDSFYPALLLIAAPLSGLLLAEARSFWQILRHSDEQAFQLPEEPEGLNTSSMIVVAVATLAINVVGLGFFFLL